MVMGWAGRESERGGQAFRACLLDLPGALGHSWAESFSGSLEAWTSRGGRTDRILEETGGDSAGRSSAGAR